MRLFYAFPVDSFDGVEYLFQPRGAADWGVAVLCERAEPRNGRPPERPTAPSTLLVARRGWSLPACLVAIAVRRINRGRATRANVQRHVLTSYGAAPGRECGGCAMCCKVYTFPEITKPAGVWCKYCKPGKGCTIHDNLPDQCRRLLLPVDDRRDHAG